MRSPSTRAVAIAWVVLSAAGCGGRSPREPGSPTGPGNAPVEMRSAEAHPRVSLVAREGDPFAVVAVAVAHDFGAVASTVLSALLEERLSSLPHAPEPRPSGSGVVVVAHVESPEEAARFVRAATAALSRPVTAEEAARAATRADAAALVRTWTSPADAATGSCIGELGSTDPKRSPTESELERVRAAAYSKTAVAFAAVGQRSVLEAASDALEDTPAWPAKNELQDPWPATSIAGVRHGGGTGATLSVALRVPDPARALEAAQALGQRGSPLELQERQLEPGFTIERVVGIARPRGSCVRVDLRPEEGAEATSRVAVRAAALALDEATLELDRSPGRAFSLDRGVLEAADPRDAAAVAAWRALAGQLPPGPLRHSVAFPGDGVENPTDASLSAAVDEARSSARRSTVEVRTTNEAGQGELWALLGNPCGARLESPDEAGATALAVRAVARQAPDIDGVRLESWVSGEGSGLLAHAARRGADETPQEHAERVGDALGRALAATSLRDDAVTAVRAEQEEALAADAPALWTTAYSALAPDHASLLDPRGTWASLASLSTQAVESRRRAFIRGSLRLATLTNSSPAQGAALERALSRWLRPLRETAAPCPRAPALVTRPGEYVVDPSPPIAGSRALVGVSILPTANAGLPVEAAITLHLLNREGGWLDRSLRVPGLVLHTEAALVGGAFAGALIVEVSAPEQKARDAAEQVRALFARLAQGAATAEDLAEAKATIASAHASAELDPRHRLVDLWLGRPDPVFPDLPALRRFQHQALAPERHVVVLTRPRP